MSYMTAGKLQAFEALMKEIPGHNHYDSGMRRDLPGMSVVLLPSSILEISNLCLRGMSLFPGEAVNAALSAVMAREG